MDVAVAQERRPAGLVLRDTWPLVLGLAALAIPTAMKLSHETWSTESGAQGPLVLVTGGWLLWRLTPQFSASARPGNPIVTAALLALSLAGYIFGRAFDFLTVEVAGVYGAGLVMLYAHLGGRLMIKNWFPFLYLAFVIPPPAYLLTQMTSPLKRFVSQISTQILGGVGIPVSREGVTIFVAQYQLLVEDACSGMNSIMGIIAISLLYIYLLRGSSWRYSLLLTACAVPIAIVANIIRIMTLILLTYFFGDDVAQGFLHYTAGFILFGMTLVLVFSLDKVFGVIGGKLGWLK